jgi:hypothetical protein
MLKGATLENLQYDAIALIALMLLAMTIAVTRFRRTLDACCHSGAGALRQNWRFASILR